MDIVVLAGGLSTERDVSFTTGSMVSEALRAKGHRVILLDVFMGYSDKEEDLSNIFERSEAVSVKVTGIADEAPDLELVKKSRKDQSDCFFGPNVIAMCRMADIVLWRFTGKTGKTAEFRQRLICLGSNIREVHIWEARLPWIKSSQNSFSG